VLSGEVSLLAGVLNLSIIRLSIFPEGFRGVETGAGLGSERVGGFLAGTGGSSVSGDLSLPPTCGSCRVAGVGSRLELSDGSLELSYDLGEELGGDSTFGVLVDDE
jgi:hypothetical protein